VSARRVVAGVALFITAGCTAAPSPSNIGFFFPQHNTPLGEGDQALLEGVVRLPGSCIVLVTDDGTTWLPIWPADVTVGRLNDLPTVVAQEGTLLVEVGDINPDDRYQLAGSEVAPDNIEIIGPLPDTCESDRFWAVTDVLKPPAGRPDGRLPAA